MTCLTPFTAKALRVRIEPTINAPFNNTDANAFSSFLRSYVLVRCIGDNLVRKLAQVTHVFVCLLMRVDIDLIQTRKRETR